MSLSAAITALSKIAVTGVTHSYDLSELPDSLHTAQLPALLPFFGDNSEPFVSGGFRGGSYEAQYSVQHLLFIEATGQRRGLRDIMPTMATLIDSYITAMKSDPFLSGAIDFGMQYTVSEPGIRQYPEDSKVSFFSVVFNHLWRENL